MNKFFEKLSRISNMFISNDYKLTHKYQNKNQITNCEVILKLLKKKNFFPKYILDIGCGFGEWTLKCLKIYPSANYLLFDADNKNIDKLLKLKYANQNIEFKICLLSDDNTVYDFYNMGYGSSIYEEQTSYSRHIEKIPSTTLLEEIPEKLKKSSSNLIKLDVQGAELKVLSGLKEFINCFEIIILEVSLHNYNKNSPLFDKIMSFMYDKNYKLYDIYDLKRLGNEKSFLLQFDCVFVKNDSELFNVKF